MRVGYDIAIQCTPDGRWAWSVWRTTKDNGHEKLTEGQETELGLATMMASQAVLRDRVMN